MRVPKSNTVMLNAACARLFSVYDLQRFKAPQIFTIILISGSQKCSHPIQAELLRNVMCTYSSLGSRNLAFLSLIPCTGSAWQACTNTTNKRAVPLPAAQATLHRLQELPRGCIHSKWSPVPDVSPSVGSVPALEIKVFAPCISLCVCKKALRTQIMRVISWSWINLNEPFHQTLTSSLQSFRLIQIPNFVSRNLELFLYGWGRSYHHGRQGRNRDECLVSSFPARNGTQCWSFMFWAFTWLLAQLRVNRPVEVLQHLLVIAADVSNPPKRHRLSFYAVRPRPSKVLLVNVRCQNISRSLWLISFQRKTGYQTDFWGCDSIGSNTGKPKWHSDKVPLSLQAW